MTKSELIKWYNSLEKENLGMPQYIEVTDANYAQILLDDKWQNSIKSWGIVCAGDKWKYFQTDSERGYIEDLRIFFKEDEAVAYAEKRLSMLYKANLGERKREKA
jgi:hypothetical protein